MFINIFHMIDAWPRVQKIILAFSVTTCTCATNLFPHILPCLIAVTGKK